jgi:segregation and condensation protein A
VLQAETQNLEPGEDVGIFDLIAALQKVLSRASQQEDLREIFEERFTVSDKIQFIQGLMEQRLHVRFSDLFPDVASRNEIVVTFLALLELIRMKQLKCVQSDTFGEIAITRGNGSLSGGPHALPLDEEA